MGLVWWSRLSNKQLVGKHQLGTVVRVLYCLGRKKLITQAILVKHIIIQHIKVVPLSMDPLQSNRDITEGRAQIEAVVIKGRAASPFSKRHPHLEGKYGWEG